MIFFSCFFLQPTPRGGDLPPPRGAIFLFGGAVRGTVIPSGHPTEWCPFPTGNGTESAAPRRVLFLLALILVILDINIKKIDVFG